MGDIRFEGLTKRFEDITAVDDVTLDVHDGEFFVLLGPSGSGKTTLLRCLAGLEDPERGTITIEDRDVTDDPPRKRNLAMVFQSYAVFPHMTVYENIAFGRRMKGESDDDKLKQRVRDAAEMLEISDLLDRYPAAMSGGQRQRVAVARAVVMEPTVLLMDEPLSNLDALLRLNFRAELKKLVKDLNTTTVYVTHDQVEALSLGDRVAVMRKGHIEQVDSPIDLYDDPVNRFVGGFMGTPPMNFLRGQAQTNGDGARVRIGEHDLQAPGLDDVGEREILLGIRGEYVDTVEGSSDDALPVTIEVVEPVGSELLLTASLGDDQELKMLVDSDEKLSAGDEVWVRPQPERIRWFDPEDGARLA
ncbi:MAG: ABC transporter ATP-binding protein [Egibacteraceae bacterium]